MPDAPELQEAAESGLSSHALSASPLTAEDVERIIKEAQDKGWKIGRHGNMNNHDAEVWYAYPPEVVTAPSMTRREVAAFILANSQVDTL